MPRPAPDHPQPRRHLILAALGAPLLLSLPGCASLNLVHCTVSSFGTWPAGRAPGRFVFDRLPSQQTAANAAEQARLETLASAALRRAGFEPAADTASADVLVQLGARVSATQRSPWDDPFWPGPWGPRFVGSPFATPGWRLGVYNRQDYTREVALLIRQRDTGQALFETRASSEGLNPGNDAVLAALFQAALTDFPQPQAEPHTVSVPVGG